MQHARPAPAFRGAIVSLSLACLLGPHPAEAHLQKAALQPSSRPASQAASQTASQTASQPSPPQGYAATAGDEASSPEEALAKLPYVPGRLIVRIDPSIGETLDRAFRNRRAVGSALASSTIDELGRRLGLRDVRPMRPQDAALATVQARRQAQEKRRRGIAAHARKRSLSTPSSLPDFSSTYIFEFSPWLDMREVARAYEAEASVVFAEPDVRVTVQYLPDDTYMTSSGAWGQPFQDLWGLHRIGAPAAWDSARGEGVVVAVSDTGVDIEHADIAANIWTNAGEIAGNGIDDDGNGYIDDLHGWDSANDDADPFDDHGHGTHVAGTIAAVGDNDLGIAGVAFQAQIMALKGISAGGSGSTTDLAQTITYAAENGADVINASWGGLGVSQVIDDAIEIAHAAGAVFVAAAGNANIDVETSGYGAFLPASNPHSVTVAAFDHNDAKASFSNFGIKIDVAAPGGGGSDGPSSEPMRTILSLASQGAGRDMTGNRRLLVDHEYIRQAGTSMAAPHVAGLAALIFSAHPGYSPDQVRTAIRMGADDLSPAGFDLQSGYGRINAAASIALDSVGVAISSPVRYHVLQATEATIEGSVGGAGFASYRLEYGAGRSPETWLPIAGPFDTPVTGGELATWDLGNVPDGDFTIRVVASNGAGDEFEERVPVTLDHIVITEPAPSSIFDPPAVVPIRGTAAGGSFESYRVEWRIVTPDYVRGPWRSDGITMPSGGASPVTEGLLAEMDASGIQQNTHVDLRVIVTQGGIDSIQEARNIVLDPTLRPGWPQKLAGFPHFDSGLRLMHHTTIADLEGDGIKEILFAYGDLVYVFEPDGSMRAGWPKTLGSADGEYFLRRSPAAADMDGDGRLEIVASAGAPSNIFLYPDEHIYIWHDDGSDMAGWPKRFHRGFNRDPDDDYYWGGSRGDFTLADVDGNGRNDIVTVIGPALFVIGTDGEPLPGWPRTFPKVYPCLASQDCFDSITSVGDVDGDGKLEIAIATEGSPKDPDARGETLVLYDYRGEFVGRFPRKTANLHYGPTSSSTWVNAPVMADIDGDSDLEIVLMTNTLRPRAFHHTGKKARLNLRVEGTDNEWCVDPISERRIRIPPVTEPPTAGDLDGDGKAEIFLSTHTKSWMWKPSGRGVSQTFCPARTTGPDFINVLASRGSIPGWPVAIDYPRGDNSYGPGPVAVADIDGDLQLDVVSGSGICGIWDQEFGFDGHVCFPMTAYDARGQMKPGFPKSTPSPGTTNGVTPAVADLDGDGLKEIVWVDFYGEILVWNIPGTPAPEKAQWPMFRHDAAHTGVLPPQ